MAPPPLESLAPETLEAWTHDLPGTSFQGNVPCLSRSGGRQWSTLVAQLCNGHQRRAPHSILRPASAPSIGWINNHFLNRPVRTRMPSGGAVKKKRARGLPEPLRYPINHNGYLKRSSLRVRTKSPACLDKVEACS